MDLVKKALGITVISLFIATSFFAQNPEILEHEKKLYWSSDSILYSPQDSPVSFYLTITGKEDSKSLLKVEKSGKTGFILKEGKNKICIPGAVTNPHEKPGDMPCMVIIADGTPPRTELNITSEGHYLQGGTTYYGKGLDLSFKVIDNMSGHENTYVSINGASYLKLDKINWDFKDGEYHVFYYSVDNVGNTEKNRESLFYSDIIPPETKIIFQDNHLDNILSSGTGVKFECIDNASGIKDIYYEIDDFGPIKYKGAFLLQGLVNEAHVISWFAIDNVGNKEEMQSFEFKYDTIPPEITFAIKGQKFNKEHTVFVSGRPQIHIDAKDVIAGTEKIEYQVGINNKLVYDGPFYLEEKGGMHKIKYWAIDKAHNKSKVTSQKVYIDNTAPETYYRFSRPSFWDKDTAVLSTGTQLSFFSTDMESGMFELNLFLNTDTVRDVLSPLTFDETGLYHVSYYASDNVMNREERQHIYLRVDSTLQVADQKEGPGRHTNQWILSEENGLTGAKDLPFYIRISETNDPDKPGYLLLLNDGKNDVPAGIKLEKHGQNMLNFRISNKRLTIPLSIDAQPPQTSVTFSGAKRYIGPNNIYFGHGLNVMLAAKDNEQGLSTGVENIFYSVNGSEFGQYKDTLKIFGMEQQYQLRYYAIDSVKNMEKYDTEKFVVDITPPVSLVELKENTFGNFLSSKSIVSIHSSDNLAGVDKIIYYFGTGNEHTTRGEIPKSILSSLPEGAHTLTYYSIDQVGNKEASRTISVFVDHSSPEVVFDISGHYYKKGNVYYINGNNQLKLIAHDQNTEVKTIQYRVNARKYIEYENEVKFPDSRGYFNLTCYCVDAVGNTTQNSIRCYYDNFPPESTIVFEGPVFTDFENKYISANTDVIVKSRDVGSGIKSILFGQSANNLKYYSGTVNIQGNGKRNLTYYAMDNLNNVEKKKSEQVFVDNIAPDLKISFNATGEKSNKNTIHSITPYTFIYISARDNVGIEGIFYEIDEEGQQVYRKPLSNFKKGRSFKLRALAIDRLGNKTTKTFKFKVD